MSKPNARQLSRKLKTIYAPLKGQLAALDYFKTVLRPYYAPIASIFPFIEPGTSLLEIGCGMGPIIFSVAAYHEIDGYLGVDMDKRALRIARSANRFTDFDFTAGSMFDIPKSRMAEYKTVLCFDILHHIPLHQKQCFLNYIIDAADENAVIIIKDLDAKPRLCAMANDLTDWLSTRSAVSYMPREDLTKHLKDKGCRILHVEKRNMWVWSHLLVVARKTGR